MAITRRTHGAATAWTTSQPIPFSASATAGDICYVIALNTVMPGAAPTGWTSIASGTANGYSMNVYKKNGPYAPGDAQPTVTAASGTGGVAWIEHYYSSTAGLTVSEFGPQVALDTTTGSTAFSATGTSVTSSNGDWLFGCMGLKSSATMTANASSVVLSQASATLGTSVGNFGARLVGANPTNSLYYNSYTRPVTTGASGAMSFTATGGAGAANVAGPAALMLLREVSNAVNVSLTGEVDPATVGAPAGSVSLTSSVTLVGALAGVTVASPNGTLALASDVALTGASVAATASAPIGVASLASNIADDGAPASATTATPPGTLAITSGISLTGAVSTVTASAPAGTLRTNVSLTGQPASITAAAPAGTVSASGGGAVSLTGQPVASTVTTPAGSLVLRSDVTLAGQVAATVAATPPGALSAGTNVTLTGVVTASSSTAPAGAVTLRSNVTLTGMVAATTLNALAGQAALTSLVSLVGSTAASQVSIPVGSLSVLNVPPGVPVDSPVLTLAASTSGLIITSPPSPLELT